MHQYILTSSWIFSLEFDWLFPSPFLKKFSFHIRSFVYLTCVNDLLLNFCLFLVSKWMEESVNYIYCTSFGIFFQDILSFLWKKIKIFFHSANTFWKTYYISSRTNNTVLWLSCHLSLFITPGRSSRLYPVSTQNWCLCWLANTGISMFRCP